MTFEEKNKIESVIREAVEMISSTVEKLCHADELDLAENIAGWVEGSLGKKRARVEKVKNYKARGGEFPLKEDYLQEIRDAFCLDDLDK